MQFPTMARCRPDRGVAVTAPVRSCASLVLCVLALGCSSGNAGQNGTAGTRGADSPMLTTDGDKYSLAFGDTYLEVDPQNGARVSALRVGGQSGADLINGFALNKGTPDEDNWGSTFWPSPQTWPWPPTGADSIGAINSAPYAASHDATSFTLKSGIAADPSVSVVKKFSADLAKEAIVIDYTLTNGGTADVTVAPWEVTRVGAGSITFYPPGDGQAQAGGVFPLPPITTAAGATWFLHTGDPTQYKLLADGKEGWLATAIGNLLLVKSFADVPAGKAAMGEAEIEIYSAQNYVEVEQQGAAVTLAAGQTLDWTVRWYARKLAAPAAVGSADLVQYVQNLIK